MKRKLKMHDIVRSLFRVYRIFANYVQPSYLRNSFNLVGKGRKSTRSLCFRNCRMASRHMFCKVPTEMTKNTGIEPRTNKHSRFSNHSATKPSNHLFRLQNVLIRAILQLKYIKHHCLPLYQFISRKLFNFKL